MSGRSRDQDTVFKKVDQWTPFGWAQVAQRIEEVRQQTRREKKRLAMAMRENQLRALGMRTNEQVRAQIRATGTTR